jgi:hypothetical protein
MGKPGGFGTWILDAGSMILVIVIGYCLLPVAEISFT